MLRKMVIAYLSIHGQDEDVIELCQKVKASSLPIDQAIKEICGESAKQLRINKANRHKDNSAVAVAQKHKVMILRYRMLGYGYDKIRKKFVEHRIKNPKTGKYYSITTITRAIRLLEQKDD